ncbi:MAG TPA: SusC/RagA family TonB-linked outer membrane protein [Chitinophagaceae bacterium]|nr:SusC/RagA family TonB-linked outer membrane protein [Chitinophagaceae bacterium]
MRKLLFFFVIQLFLLTGLWSQDRTITGRVTDSSGAAVANASVLIKDSKIGVVTKADGSFSLRVPSNAKLIEISSVGFETQTVDLSESVSTYLVTLKSQAAVLDALVLTGYSRVRRSQFSGASTKVSQDKLNYVPNASFDQILQGKAPGLLVTAGSGQPGASARVQIRGASSITGGNAPLFILDGMPIENGVFQSLNPNDFESVDVLRDAVSTAQYGNRGSNGVIVITTKKGRADKMSVTYTGQYGITQPGEQKFDMMNSSELLSFQELLGKSINNNLPGWFYSRNNPANASLPPATLTQYDFKLDSLRAINTNWNDIFQEDGKFQSHDLNLSGGSGTTRYFISGGYYDEDGIGLRSDLKRYTVRANIDSKTDKLTLSFGASGGYTKRNFIESENGVALANPFAATYLALPYQKLFRESDGKPDVGAGKVGPNAYDRIFTTTSFNDQVKVMSNLSANYDITNNFYVGGFGGVDFRHTVSERSVYPNTYASNNAGFPTGPPSGSTVGGGNYGNGYTQFLQYIVRGIGGFKKVFDKIHDVDLQLITEYTREKEQSFGYTGYGINPKLLNTPVGITPGTTGNALIPAVTGGKTGRSLYAGMLLAKYTLKNKYTLNGSLRRDASSQLPEDNRWETFYAAGVTWDVLKEEFTENWDWLNELRLRVSYGKSANADGFSFGNFGYLASYGSGTYAGQQTIVPDNAGNPNVNWEKIYTFNLGIDFGLLKRRITGSIDAYDKTLTDGIITQTLPAESGFFSQPVNAAKVQNRGVELAVNGEIVRTKDISWSVGGNIAYNDNEIKSLGQVNEFEQGTEIVRVGLPIGSHYIVKWGGVDAATGAPLYYTKDGVLTNVYSDDNRVADFGTYNAPWIGGYNTTVRLYGFTVEAFFTFQDGFSRFNNQDFFQLNHAFALQGFNLRKEMLTMWQKPGQVTNIQSPIYQRQFSSKDIQDASFTRFRTLTVSYNLPKNILNKTKVLSAARIYVQGQNLYTWTNWVGFDPEDDDNIAQYEYPTPRTFNAGISVTFK